MNEVLIYDLFTMLRKEKRLVVGGTGEYLLLQEFFDKGFKFKTFEDLEFALETVVVKNKAEQLVFRSIMGEWRKRVEAYANAQRTSLVKLKSTQVAAPSRNVKQPGTPNPLAATDAQLHQPAPEAITQTQEVSADVTPLAEEYEVSASMEEGEITLTKADTTGAGAGTMTRGKDSAAVQLDESKTYLFGTEYFPVQKRYLQQNWRSLKNRQEVGETPSIDLDKTIKHIAKTGIFLGFEYRKEEKNLLSLFIFADRGDGMSAFGAFGEELAVSARESLVHVNTRNYYFNNLPQKRKKNDIEDYVLFNEDSTKSYTITSLFSNLNRNNIVVLIYSDAGAVKGTDRKWLNRVEQTENFLHYLLKLTGCVVWLNPVPRLRWENTPAQDISKMFAEMPMFEADHIGISQATNALKGKLLFK
jgi:uncharacterized protein with von Willebrand factor type A (vWA) domain